ncbi:UxaA family hydrolase [Luteimonas suaedae]|uniref:UxaA family hydrolase n=1 Tax=Luteimonas suaedae TaxID=2605430 RepID=UPI0011EE3CBB|nr:altronate dehydratase family protein [Luteimonas suaedae]
MTRMPFLQLHPTDNVAIATTALPAGTRLSDFALTTAADIPVGHKFATTAIVKGHPVLKYGHFIGAATQDIAAGDHVHTHNLAFAEHDASPVAARRAWTPGSEEHFFQGYRRPDGRAATRNYVGVIATVNCSATVVRKVAERFSGDAMASWPQVDGVVPVTHATGCGLASTGPGIELLQRTLGGFIDHPNFAGVLVIGLGCEVNDVERLLQSQNLTTGRRLRTMTIQDAGGTMKTVSMAEGIVRELLEEAETARREPIPASELVLGLQCGGSDSFSGITANPALGFAADKLVRAGGTVILAETPEIYGAESLLFERAETPQVREDLQRLLDWWEDHTARHGASLDNNPSPGNIAGGLTTILEKSLGAVAKSGSSPLRGVYRYAERIDRRGFVFMDSPGYDPCSATGEIASGANMICFTTGRGSVFGAKPVPSLKLATNSEMARRMAEDIDCDCGSILERTETPQESGARIFDLILATASGRKSASEVSGFGDLEFVPWQLGAVL